MQNKIKCILVDDEPMARKVLQKHLASFDFIEVVALCKDAFEAQSVLANKAVDLVFLDIQMPHMTGLKFKDNIDPNIAVVVTTAHREHALEGFEKEVLDYLLKPITADRLLQSLNKYLKMQGPSLEPSTAAPQQKNYIFVSVDRKKIRVELEHIHYVEGSDDQVKIWCKDKAITTRRTLSEMLLSLPADRFLRIHRSFVVAKNKIDAYTNEYMEVAGQQLPISRSYKIKVLEALD